MKKNLWSWNSCPFGIAMLSASLLPGSKSLFLSEEDWSNDFKLKILFAINIQNIGTLIFCCCSPLMLLRFASVSQEFGFKGKNLWRMRKNQYSVGISIPFSLWWAISNTIVINVQPSRRSFNITNLSVIKFVENSNSV